MIAYGTGELKRRYRGRKHTLQGMQTGAIGDVLKQRRLFIESTNLQRSNNEGSLEQKRRFNISVQSKCHDSHFLFFLENCCSFRRIEVSLHFDDVVTEYI